MVGKVLTGNGITAYGDGHDSLIGGDALHCGQDHVAGAITRLFSGAALQRCAESVRLSLSIFGESGEDLLAGRLCIKAGDLSEARVDRGARRLKGGRLLEKSAFAFSNRDLTLCEEGFTLAKSDLSETETLALSGNLLTLLTEPILSGEPHAGDLPLRGNDQCTLLLTRLFHDAARANGGGTNACSGNELSNEDACDETEYDGNYGEDPAKVFHRFPLPVVLRGLARGNRSVFQPGGWGLKATTSRGSGQTPRGGVPRAP